LNFVPPWVRFVATLRPPRTEPRRLVMSKPETDIPTRPQAGAAVERLMQIMAVLRSPSGCPWDAEQTPESLKPYIIEEAYETLDAIDQQETGAIRDELGDLLLQIVFQARIFEERGEFSLEDVATAIADKLVRRHPHVFADAPTGDMQSLSDQWEKIKAAENRDQGKPPKSLRDLPRHLPALQTAAKLAGKIGSESDPVDLLANASQQLDRLTEAVRQHRCHPPEDLFGQLLFTLAQLGSVLNLDAEQVLRKTNNRLIEQFHANFNPDRQED